MIKSNNGGKFPSGKVVLIFQGAENISAHGNTEMTLRGPIFHSFVAQQRLVAQQTTRLCHCASPT
jgi:hypothetical protein